MGIDIVRTQNTRSNGEYQRDYLWRVLLPDLTSSIGIPDGSNVRNQFFSNMLYEFQQSSWTGGGPLNVPLQVGNQVKGITIPFPTIETDKQRQGNEFWYYAKANDISTLSMEFVETIDGLVFNYFNGWQLLVTGAPANNAVTTTGVNGLPPLPTITSSSGFAADNGPLRGQVIPYTNLPPYFYKFDISVIRMHTTKLDLYQDTFTGCFVSGVSEVSSSYDTTGLMTYSVTFTIDGYSGRSYVSGDSVAVKESVVANMIDQYLVANNPLGVNQGTLGALTQLIGSTFG